MGKAGPSKMARSLAALYQTVKSSSIKVHYVFATWLGLRGANGLPSILLFVNRSLVREQVVLMCLPKFRDGGGEE